MIDCSCVPWGLYDGKLYRSQINQRPLESTGLIEHQRIMSGSLFAQPAFRQAVFDKVYSPSLLNPYSMGGSFSSVPSGGWKPANNPQDPDATPDFDEWGWDDYWGCTEWVDWHKALKDKYGKDEADKRWGTAWSSMSSFAAPINCRSFDTYFRDYFKKEGLLDFIYSGVSWIKWIGAGTDVLSKGADVVSSGAKGAAGAAEQLEWLGPAALIAAVAIGGVVLYQYLSTGRKALAKVSG